MSNNTTRHVEGVADKAIGAVKKGVGQMIGNEQMEAEGRARELKGEAKVAAVKAAERVQGKAEELTGAAKKKIGDVIDNEQMQAEGAVREAKGNARQAINK